MNILNSGERPRRKSDDKTEASLAIWVERALRRRTRACSNRPCERQLTAKETAHLNSIVRASVPPPQVGINATSNRLRHKEPEPERVNKLDMKSSQRVMKERCRELGLFVHGENSIVRASVAPPQVGNNATSKRLRHKEPEPERVNKLDMKSSQRVMKERCRELGLFVHGDKQALLARILNEENRLTTDSQVKDNDTDQEMLGTHKGTESMPIMDNMLCQHRQTEIIAETPFKRSRMSAPMEWK